MKGVMLARAGYKGPEGAGMKAPLEEGSEDPGAWLEFQTDSKSLARTKMGSEGSYAFPCPWRETPLLESPALSEAAGWYVFRYHFAKGRGLTIEFYCSRVFCKLENLQPSGSFKSRYVYRRKGFMKSAG
jgi:hypothetical protein